MSKYRNHPTYPMISYHTHEKEKHLRHNAHTHTLPDMILERAKRHPTPTQPNSQKPTTPASLTNTQECDIKLQRKYLIMLRWLSLANKIKAS